MSIDRLNMLKKYLSSNGWEVINNQVGENDLDLYKIVDQKIIWNLKHRDPKIQPIQIEFFLFGDLGEITFDLNDLAFCNVVGNTERLFFTKINGSVWKNDYKRFVVQLFNS